MTLKTQMALDAAAVLNTDEFADEVSYNGATATIHAVVDVGESNLRGNGIADDGSSNRAVIHLSAADVASPATEDTIVAGATTWRVIRILSSDSAMHSLECVSNESPMRRW